MATDPPYLVDYDGGNHPQTWGEDGKCITSEEKTKHWDAYVDHDTSVAFYESFLRGRPGRGPRRRRRCSTSGSA